MSTQLEIARKLFSSEAKTRRTYPVTTSVRTGTVTAIGDDGTVSIELLDTGDTITVRTDTPLAVGNVVNIIKSGQSTIVYATEELVGMINGTVVSGDAEYAVNQSKDTAPDDGWSTDVPQVSDGYYLWMRYKTELRDGTVSYSTPVCLSSADGKDGVGIESVRDMYYLSTSDTSCIGGSWVYDECPEWQEDHYIWTRMEIAYDDGSVKQTDPILMSALNQANENAQKTLWYVSSDTSGLHISSVKNDPDSGFNIVLTGNSMQFRDGTDVVGEYTGSSLSFMGSSTYSTNVFRITRDLSGTTYFGGQGLYLTFGEIEGTDASQRYVSIQDVVMRAKYCGGQVTRACSYSKTLTSSDSTVSIGYEVGLYNPMSLIYTGESYIRVTNPFYSRGAKIVVEVSASATAGEMSSGKNLALSIYMGTSSSFSYADSVACAITSSAGIMTAAAIPPTTINVTGHYAYFFLAARSTGGGGVFDSYSSQPSYCPKMTVRIVNVEYD